MGTGRRYKGCFDNISHDWLLANIPLDKQVLGKWLKAGFMESGRRRRLVHHRRHYFPVLANLALDGLEAVLETHFGKKTPKPVTKLRSIVRYADDFIITGISKELLEDEVKPSWKPLWWSGTVSPEKTVITHISEGFDFLGQNA